MLCDWDHFSRIKLELNIHQVVWVPPQQPSGPNFENHWSLLQHLFWESDPRAKPPARCKHHGGFRRYDLNVKKTLEEDLWIVHRQLQLHATDVFFWNSRPDRMVIGIHSKCLKHSWRCLQGRIVGWSDKHLDRENDVKVHVISEMHLLLSGLLMSPVQMDDSVQGPWPVFIFPEKGIDLAYGHIMFIISWPTQENNHKWHEWHNVVTLWRTLVRSKTILTTTCTGIWCRSLWFPKNDSFRNPQPELKDSVSWKQASVWGGEKIIIKRAKMWINQWG